MSRAERRDQDWAQSQVGDEGQVIPKIATVTVKKAVDGTKRRATAKRSGRSLSEPVHTHVKVDPRIMAVAKANIKPGQRLVIVDAECVRLVNS